MRKMIVAGAVGALLAVALGAFGAHGLKDILEPEKLAAFETGVQYQMYHSLGLLLIGLFGEKSSRTVWARRAGWWMIAGIILFSGSLYALSTTGISKLGIITPFGGVSFLIGWVCVLLAATKQKDA